jgi:hypothetical protein
VVKFAQRRRAGSPSCARFFAHDGVNVLPTPLCREHPNCATNEISGIKRFVPPRV